MKKIEIEIEQIIKIQESTKDLPKEYFSYNEPFCSAPK
jgi:hypothetical protein